MRFTAILGLLGFAAAAAVPNSDEGLPIGNPGDDKPVIPDIDTRAERVARSAGGMFGAAISGYDTRFINQNKDILKRHNLYAKTLYRSKKIGDVDIKWKQQKRCFWGCKEKYSLHQYYEYGSKANVFIYFAPGASAPRSLSTNGYSSGGKKLHFGYTYISGKATNGQKVGSVFFVVHPNSWGPFQKRFSTSLITSATLKVMEQASKKGGKWAAASAGAAIGGPVGAVAGVVVQAAAADAYDRFAGDYLRYIG